MSAAEAEPNAVSLLAGGKTSCVSGDSPGGTEGAGAVRAGKGAASFIRRRDQIGMLGCDFDAAIGRGIGDQFLIVMGKQKEAEAKINDDGRCCDNAERDEVEHRASITLSSLAVVRSFGGSGSVPGALGYCDSAFRDPLFVPRVAAPACRDRLPSIRGASRDSPFPQHVLEYYLGDWLPGRCSILVMDT